jgi:serine protease
MRAGLAGFRAACAAAAAWAASGIAANAASPAGVASTPNDPGFRDHQQWGLLQAGFPAAWCRSTGAGALIVVIDTGVAASHPDLAGKVVGEAGVRQGTVTTGPGAAADDAGHGTHVAGIAAAVTGNGVGIAGAAPDAKLFAVKVLFAGAGTRDQGSQSDLVQAIDYAVDKIAPWWGGPVVFNISIGAADPAGTSAGTLSSSGADIDGAIERAHAAGVAVAVAAGNAGTTAIGSAAVQRGAALSVGALDQNEEVAPYSPATGVSIFAAGGSASAPGRYTSTGILSTWPHSSSGDYAWMAGTSMAAPHVSAALALLMSTGMSNRKAYQRLLASADERGRMHVDAALGSNAPCGPAAPPPVAAARAGRVPAAHVDAPPGRTGGPASASAAASPSASATPQLPQTGPPVATAAQVGGGGHPWLTSVGLGLGAALVVWLALPRRWLRRAGRG